MPGRSVDAGGSVALDLDRIAALETAACHGWPATVQTVTASGWVLRATPGLDRARSNHALTPCRALQPSELDPAVDAVRAFAVQHGIGAGIQVSPQGLHDELERRLAAQGWQPHWPARVLIGAPRVSAAPTALELCDHADPGWLRAWARCEPGRDVEAHARTVLGALAGRAHFARIAEEAVGIAVPGPGTLGLYCVAVDPTRRRRGLGRAITEGLIALHPETTVFLQVEAGNHAADALYSGLGMAESHRYAHWVAPAA